MCKAKKKRKELQAPEYVRKEWESGDKNALAEMLQSANFNKDIFKIENRCSCLFWLFLRFCSSAARCVIHQSIFSKWPLSQEKFFDQLLVVVRRKKSFQLTVDEGWYSEADLQELGWSESDSYFSFYSSCTLGYDLFWHSCTPVCPSILFWWPLILRSMDGLRKKIKGAKAKCTALGETHCRPNIDYDSQFLWASRNLAL